MGYKELYLLGYNIVYQTTWRYIPEDTTIHFLFCWKKHISCNQITSSTWRNKLWHMGDWRYSFTILDLGTRQRWVVSFMPRSLNPWGKRAQYPLERRFCGPQSWSGRYGEEKSYPCQELNPGSPTHIQSLYWLSYPSSILLLRINKFWFLNCLHQNTKPFLKLWSPFSFPC
jgi:hypothetical protein